MIATQSNSILDLATQQGDAQAAVYLALLNNATIHELLIPGTELQDQEVVYKRHVFEPLVVAGNDTVPTYQLSSYQSLLDVAMQTAGDATAAIALALDNDQALESVIAAGNELTTTAVVYEPLVEYLNKQGIVLATGEVNDLVAVDTYYLTSTTQEVLVDELNNRLTYGG